VDGTNWACVCQGVGTPAHSSETIESISFLPHRRARSPGCNRGGWHHWHNTVEKVLGRSTSLPLMPSLGRAIRQNFPPSRQFRWTMISPFDEKHRQALTAALLLLQRGVGTAVNSWCSCCAHVQYCHGYTWDFRLARGHWEGLWTAGCSNTSEIMGEPTKLGLPFVGLPDPTPK
jgi:hypothetical protein